MYYIRVMNYKVDIGQWTGDKPRIWTLILTFEDGSWLELEINKDKKIECICGNVDECPDENELTQILDKWL